MNTSKATPLRPLVAGISALALVAMASISAAQEDDGSLRRGRSESRAGGPSGGQGFRGPGGSGGPAGQRGMDFMIRLPVIAALDADRDGVLSESEIANAAVALKKLDRNKDGRIDREEMRPPGGPGPRGAGSRGAGPRDQGAERAGTGRKPVGDDQPRGTMRFGQSAPGDGKAMLNWLMGQDKNQNGLLESDEIPERMSRMMERGDQDGDGKLSRQEIEQAIKTLQGRINRDGGRPGGRGDSDTPGGERPRRPPTE